MKARIVATGFLAMLLGCEERRCPVDGARSENTVLRLAPAQLAGSAPSHKVDMGPGGGMDYEAAKKPPGDYTYNYGDDGRVPLKDLIAQSGADSKPSSAAKTTPPWQVYSQATVALIDASLLEWKEGAWQLQKANMRSVEDGIKAAYKLPSCKGMAFASQPRVASCTAVAVGPHTILTAAHCNKDPRTLRAVFGFQDQGSGLPNAFPAENVFAVSSSGPPNDLFDAQLLITKEAVPAYVPLPSAPREFPKATSVWSIGFPAHMPLMVSRDASLLGEDRKDLQRVYLANLDVQKGASGSPVFVPSTGEFVGLLVGGDEDFVCSRKCCRWFQCSDNLEDCVGEAVIPSALLRAVFGVSLDR